MPQPRPLNGAFYVEVLRRLHAYLQPRRYLEVGVDRGNTLSLAGGQCLAIDPALDIAEGVIGAKTACHFYRMPSDRFFADHDPRAILGGPVDLAFLDGMHLFEFLLRDFRNVERACRPNAVIALHDCIPTDTIMARRAFHDPALQARTETPSTWTGDVWKIIPYLRATRPDLAVHCLDAAWTGLVLVTNLDPGRDAPPPQDALYQSLQAADLETYGMDRFAADLQLRATADFASDADLARHMWG